MLHHFEFPPCRNRFFTAPAKHLTCMVKSKVAREGKEEKLQKACQKLRENQRNGQKLQIAKTATYYGVPQSTLRDRFRGAHLPARKAHRDQQLLSEEKEKVLVEWIEHLDAAGSPISRRTIKQKVHARGPTVAFSGALSSKSKADFLELAQALGVSLENARNNGDRSQRRQTRTFYRRRMLSPLCIHLQRAEDLMLMVTGSLRVIMLLTQR
ncbi:hypothetical protein F4604DRAFT_1791761 [Suillus subluteus]|nr:hypothetical protein F4604DRAFT_1791761 [Suillus subluteus]